MIRILPMKQTEQKRIIDTEMGFERDSKGQNGVKIKITEFVFVNSKAYLYMQDQRVVLKCQLPNQTKYEIGKRQDLENRYIFDQDLPIEVDLKDPDLGAQRIIFKLVNEDNNREMGSGTFE